MLTARPLSRFASHSKRAFGCCLFSTKAPAPSKAPTEDESAVVSVTERRDEMTKFDRHMVWGKTGEVMPAPVLPEAPKEIASLDPADLGHRTLMNGETRTVVICQESKKVRQAPLNPEACWRINFCEDGVAAEQWENSLMGWTSNADPYQGNPPLEFANAAEAVYFAKKRGWKYVVHRPITRPGRKDNAQYQDNFLPQSVAAKVKMEGISCDEWHRTSAGTSHYFRPLKYHGDGTVKQYGPNGDAPIAPHVDGYYKMR